VHDTLTKREKGQRTGKKVLRNKERVRRRRGWLGPPTQTSKGLEDREKGREERAREQDREGEKGKKGEPAGQGGTTRNDQTGSRTEKERQKNLGQEAGQRDGERKQGPGSSTAVEKEALGQ